MYQASFFENVFIFIVVSYLLYRIMVRWVFPWFVKRQLRKFEQNFYQQNPNAARANERQKSKDGDVKVSMNEPKKSDKDELGDYIDFEDIDE